MMLWTLINFYFKKIFRQISKESFLFESYVSDTLCMSRWRVLTNNISMGTTLIISQLLYYAILPEYCFLGYSNGHYYGAMLYVDITEDFFSDFFLSIFTIQGFFFSVKLYTLYFTYILSFINSSYKPLCLLTSLAYQILYSKAIKFTSTLKVGD